MLRQCQCVCRPPQNMSWSIVWLQVSLALAQPLYPILQCNNDQTCSVEDPSLLGLAQDQLGQQLQLVPLQEAGQPQDLQLGSTEPESLLGRKNNTRSYLFLLHQLLIVEN